jgi:hypothetical protein
VGATGWRYYTPYRPDPESALQTLRAAVFSRGDYVDLTGSPADALRQMAQRFGQDPDDPAMQQIIGDSLRIQRAIETGDMQGLSRADRAFVRRVRELTRLAGQLGAVPPRRGGPPRTIDELLEQAAESGTHSVLDIERVARRPGFGVAAPLSPAAVCRAFGSAEPTHEQVEAGWDSIAERVGRWQARYLVVYRDGEPDEYVFIGCSGD